MIINLKNDKKIFKKLLYWIGALLSDSKFASTRRFIGL